MARTVDPYRYAARRLAIIDAALSRFAVDGYDGTTTASICRQAGIASGTFFHYFPTKADVLLAILDLGTAETREWFAAQAGRCDALQVLHDWLQHNLEDFADPRLPGFVRAVSSVLNQPTVAAALLDDDRAQHEGLAEWLALAQQAGEVRVDLTPDRLATWVFLILDGFIGRLATEPDFEVATEADMLRETIFGMLGVPGGR